jgi:hypothetical protein
MLLFASLQIAAALLLTCALRAAAEPAFLKAYDASGALVVDVQHEATGEDAWLWLQDARDAGKVDVVHRFLGPVPVVYKLNGVTMDLQLTGWCVTKIEAGTAGVDGKWPNVGLKEVNINAGDTLLFELLEMGSFPSRREKQPVETTVIESEEDDL